MAKTRKCPAGMRYRKTYLRKFASRTRRIRGACIRSQTRSSEPTEERIRRYAKRGIKTCKAGTILRNTYVEPPLGSYLGVTAPPNEVCVLKSTANNPNPTIVNPNATDQQGNLLYKPTEVVHVIRKTEANTLAYTFDVRAFVESYNFLRVMGGIANVVFSS
jgi:hypothetical protein